MNIKKNKLIPALAIMIFLSTLASAQMTEFVYQGQLQNSSMPASGSFDFEFLLFDTLAGANQIGSTLTRNNVVVTNGIFSVKLDFAANYPGANRFLEIHVRPTGGGGFTPLTPRQQYLRLLSRASMRTWRRTPYSLAECRQQAICKPRRRIGPDQS